MGNCCLSRQKATENEEGRAVCAGIEAGLSCTLIQRHVGSCMPENTSGAVEHCVLHSRMKSAIVCSKDDANFKNDEKDKLLDVILIKKDSYSWAAHQQDTDDENEKLLVFFCSDWPRHFGYGRRESIQQVLTCLAGISGTPLPLFTPCRYDMIFTECSSEKLTNSLVDTMPQWKLIKDCLFAALSAAQSIKRVPGSSFSQSVLGASCIGVDPSPKQPLFLTCMNCDAQYCDDFVEKHFDLFRAAFLRQYGVEICNALEEVFGEEVELWQVPASVPVKRNFVTLLKQQREKTIAPALHGTCSSNFASIFEHGLLIPGHGNELEVVNGSYHGLGIYTANLNAAWLSKRFCSHARMLVCAVVQSPSVSQVMDAQVVFDASHVVPLFVGIGKMFCYDPFPQTSLPLPKPLTITKLLDASLGGNLESCFRMSKQRVFYTGISFMLEDKHRVMYGAQCWVMSGSADLSANSNIYVQVYFEGQQNPVVLAADQLSNYDPGLPGNFSKGDDVFLLTYNDLDKRRDYRMSLLWLFANARMDQFGKKTRGRGSHGNIIDSAMSAHYSGKVVVQFDGEKDPVRVCADKLSRTPPALASFFQANQVIFYKGMRRNNVDWGQQGRVLFESSKDCLMVQFPKTRMSVTCSDLTIRKPAHPDGLYIGCMVYLTRDVLSYAYEDYDRHNPFSVWARTCILIRSHSTGVIIGSVSEHAVLVQFLGCAGPRCVDVQDLETGTFKLSSLSAERCRQVGFKNAQEEAKMAAKQQKKRVQWTQRHSNKRRHLEKLNSLSVIGRPKRTSHRGGGRHR